MAPLGIGSRVGPYQILDELGAGGMGVVYRAHDTRLDRDVAVKVLAANLARSIEAVRRFELEARAASALDHPNVMRIYDVGTFEGAPYQVSELLMGSTLRDLLRAPLAPDKVLDWAIQFADGLAAAHAKGVVHRDLKPENLFISNSGLKIIDFGIAKLINNPAVVPPRWGGNPDAAPLETVSGTVMGTVAYMAPEQVQGKRADHRTDIFAFGAILYEMICGRRAFSGNTPFETANAILRRDPDPLPRGTAPELDDVVRHCLQKSAERRFESTRELLERLMALRTQPPVGTRSIIGAALDTLRGTRMVAGTRWLGTGRGRGRAALLIGALAVAAAVASLFLRPRESAVSASFQQVTFRLGSVWSARFAPDGQVLYSSAWDGKPVQSHAIVPGRTESRSVELPPARVLAVSGGSELAIAIETKSDLLDYMRTGTLARASLTGGAPRELMTRVYTADWGPDGVEMAVVRDVDGRTRLEFPAGNLLYETAGWISDARVSPARQVAFIEHPFFGDTRGIVMRTAKGEPAKPLTADFGSAMGLAWSPKGDEVWFTAGETLQSSALRAVTLKGEERILLRSAGAFHLHDVARDGRVLLAQERWHHFIRGRGPGGEERNLSHLDYSMARELSADGRKLLFFEAGQGGGELFGAYVRRMDGAPPVQVGVGYALSLTADGNWALLASTKDPSQLILVPTGAGQSRTLSLPIAAIAEARWLPDGKQVLLTARERADGPLRVFILDVDAVKLRPLTEAGVAGQEPITKPSSPDGKRVLIRRQDGYFIYPVDGKEPVPVPKLAEGEIPIGWSSDARSLLVRQSGLPTRVVLLNLKNGIRTAWRDFMPPDPVGVSTIPWIHVAQTSEGDAYAYSHHQIVSELYLVRGVQ